jgi:hypothetical protein
MYFVPSLATAPGSKTIAHRDSDAVLSRRFNSDFDLFPASIKEIVKNGQNATLGNEISDIAWEQATRSSRARS